MKKFLKKFHHTICLLAVVLLAFCLAMLGVPAVVCFAVVACYQLLQFAMSKKCGVLYTTPLFTPEQLKEFDNMLGEMLTGEKSGGTTGFRESLKTLLTLPQKITDLETAKTKAETDLKNVNRILLQRGNHSDVRVRGRLSDAMAAKFGAYFVLQLHKKGKLDSCVPDVSLRTALLSETRSLFGIADEKVLGTADIPLPTQFFSEIHELIAEYGVARRIMTPWPLSGGTDSPPRQKTRFGLTKTAMGAQLTEKGVQIEFASLESHKLGGIIYTPRELREQSIVMLGQYIARLGAIAAAQAEDEYAFLADGTATYDSISGVCKIASTNNKVIQLAAGKTDTASAVVANLRAVFAKVNSRVRATGEWYLNNTWEAYLPELNTQANQYTFRYNAAGEALLFGRKINWVEVLAPYSTDANPSAYFAVFGDLSYWWFASRGSLRIDESSDFKFDYDLIATRMIEEIDVDYMATDAACAVQTAAV